MIRRIREGDKHIQTKLAEHASQLEVKLNQANMMLAAMHDDANEGTGERPSAEKHEALRSFTPNSSVGEEVEGQDAKQSGRMSKRRGHRTSQRRKDVDPSQRFDDRDGSGSDSWGGSSTD